MNAQAQAANTNRNLSSSLEKLSSGLRINKAADDASGMAIADKLRTQASSLNQSIRNANDGIALVQIADMAMSEQSNILDTVKTKLIQAKNATTSGEGVQAIARDIQKLLTNLNDIANNTNYNGNTLLQAGNGDTTKHSNFTFHVGERGDQTIEVKSANMIAANTGLSGMASGKIAGMTKSGTGTVSLASGSLVTYDLGMGSGMYASQIISAELAGFAANTSISATSAVSLNFLLTAGGVMASLANAGSTAGAVANTVKTEIDSYISAAMASVDESLNDLNKMRSEFGATQNQLESAVRNLSVTEVNLKNAESGIRDVDYAKESANFNKNNIIAQAGTYAMSQANALQQNVQRLLQ
jgi:flagellin